MRFQYFFIFVFTIISTISNFAQESDSLSQVEVSEDKDLVEWHTSPSLRWNVTAVANPWFPAASLVFEYPLNKIVGLEVEGGLLLSNVDARFKGEKLSGFRVRVGPKLYVHRNDDDLVYLRFMIKYDYYESSILRSVLDASQSFTEVRLVKGKLKNIGYLFYGGYMASFYNHRLVLDLSLGLGYTRWEEKLTIPDGATLLAGERTFGQRNNLTGAIPVLSLNLQFGYRF